MIKAPPLQTPFSDSLLPAIAKQPGVAMQGIANPANIQGNALGIGGLFQNMLKPSTGQSPLPPPQPPTNLGGGMSGNPLGHYGNYLNQTYVVPSAQEEQQKVQEFMDMVTEAEKLHFADMVNQQNQSATAPSSPTMPADQASLPNTTDSLKFDPSRLIALY